MDNIYGQTELERNSIVSIPDKFAEDAGNTLYSWLGSIWRSIHSGDDMVRGLQGARGIRLAQLYVDILEAAKLQDRNGAPVFHRELWHPIVVRMSQRNKSQENMLEIGGDVEKVIGKQGAGSEYGTGTVFEIGRLANYENYVTYPIGSGISGGALSIVDNIISPTVSLKGDLDYFIRNDSIIFHKGNDPLADGSPFEKIDLPNIVENGDGSLGADVEAVLWASDVLIDRDYLADHLSYALGAAYPSSDVAKRILNAAWSATNDGLTEELVKTLLAAMLNVPVIQNDEETVVEIYGEYDDDTLVSQVVRTDKGAYRVSPKATLCKTTRSGAVLRRGTLLDETLRVYPRLNVDSSLDDLFSKPVKQDVPSVVIPSSLLRAKTERGVYAMWGETVVKQYDDDGNHLYFEVGGDSGDVLEFWKDIWANSDESGTSMEAILGKKGSKISPAAFFLKHLVGANTMFVVIDRSMADDMSMVRNPMFFDMLSDVVPSAMRLVLVEHDAVRDDTDLGETTEKPRLKAALPKAVDDADDMAELVAFRFVRAKPTRTRGKKEE